MISRISANSGSLCIFSINYLRSSNPSVFIVFYFTFLYSSKWRVSLNFFNSFFSKVISLLLSSVCFWLEIMFIRLWLFYFNFSFSSYKNLFLSFMSSNWIFSLEIGDLLVSNLMPDLYKLFFEAKFTSELKFFLSNEWRTEVWFSLS